MLVAVRRCVFVTLVAVALLHAMAADALASTTARLVYLKGPGTESCPDEGDLRDAVAARLGYDPFTPFALETLFTEVDKDATGFVARMKLVSHGNAVRGARTLQTTGPCSDLMASLALTISIAIDPMAGTRKGPPEGLPPGEREVDVDTSSPRTDAPTADEAVVPEPAAAAAAAAEPQPSPRVDFSVGAGTMGSVGYAPGAAIGFAAFARARLGELSLTLEGRADLPAGADTSGGGRVASSLLAVSLVPCGHAGLFFGCARGSLGRLLARGIDVSEPGSTGVLWAAVGIRAGLEVPLGRVLAVRLHVDGDALVTRYALRLDGVTRYRYPGAAGGVGVALIATFP